MQEETNGLFISANSEFYSVCRGKRESGCECEWEWEWERERERKNRVRMGESATESLARASGDALLRPPPAVRSAVLGWSGEAIDVAISLAMKAPYRFDSRRSVP